MRDRAKQPNKLYNTTRWRKLRKAQLISQPLCEMCKDIGNITEATVVDHVEPHRGNEDKFWTGPFQSLCKQCHDSHKQRQENGGGVMGCDEQGFPIDSDHSWAKA